MAAPFRTLIEAPEYTAQLDYIVRAHPLEIIEPILLALLWGVASNPEGYDRVTWNIRIAKSRSFELIGPRLVVLFQIKTEDEVLLLWIDELSKMEEFLKGR